MRLRLWHLMLVTPVAAALCAWPWLLIPFCIFVLFPICLARLDIPFQKQFGFSLIEGYMVLVIIAILIWSLLPAVQVS